MIPLPSVDRGELLPPQALVRPAEDDRLPASGAPHLVGLGDPLVRLRREGVPLSGERWTDDAPGSRPPEADGGAVGQGCRLTAPLEEGGAARVNLTGSAGFPGPAPPSPGVGGGGRPGDAPPGAIFSRFWGVFGPLPDFPKMAILTPKMGGSWTLRKWPENARFSRILGPPARGGILGRGAENPEKSGKVKKLSE